MNHVTFHLESMQLSQSLDEVAHAVVSLKYLSYVVPSPFSDPYCSLVRNLCFGNLIIVSGVHPMFRSPKRDPEPSDVVLLTAVMCYGEMYRVKQEKQKEGMAESGACRHQRQSLLAVGVPQRHMIPQKQIVTAHVSVSETVGDSATGFFH